ncbi:MAG: ArsR/SmtB family transcription factor [Anaerolineaceae bacterium]
MDKFSALSDPTRRSILEILAREGKLSASEIYERFEVSPSAISQHLKILRDANFVQVEKKAQQRLYGLNQDAVAEVEDWTRKMTRLWEQRYDALEEVIEAEKVKFINRKDE